MRIHLPITQYCHRVATTVVHHRRLASVHRSAADSPVSAAGDLGLLGARRCRPNDLCGLHRRPDAGLSDLRQSARRVLPGGGLLLVDAQLDRPGRVPNVTLPLPVSIGRRDPVRVVQAHAGCCWCSPTPSSTSSSPTRRFEPVGTRCDSRPPLYSASPRSSGSSSNCPRSTGFTSPSSTSPRPWRTTRGCGVCSPCLRSPPPPPAGCCASASPPLTGSSPSM